MKHNPLPAGKKQLDIRAVLSEAWQLIYGIKWPVFWLGLLLMFIFFITTIVAVGSLKPLLHLLAPGIFPLSGLATASLASQQAAADVSTFSILISISVILLILFLLYLLVWFITSTLVMLGVRQSIGLPAKAYLAFRDCKNASQPLIGLFGIFFVLIMGLSLIGAILAKIPIIGTILRWLIILVSYYFAWAITTFSLPLAVTKRYPPVTVFTIGLQAMNRNWIQVILLYLIMSIVIVISAIPLGLGLIWTLPMGFAVTGIIFREVFGLMKRTPTAADLPAESEEQPKEITEPEEEPPAEEPPFIDEEPKPPQNI